MYLKGIIIAGVAVIGGVSIGVANFFHKKKGQDEEDIFIPVKHVFDQEGFDNDGFDRQGYNRLGFDKFGYDKLGYDNEGFSRKGYSVLGYNREGKDQAGYSRDYYAERIEKLKNRHQDSLKMMKEHKYRYAIFDAKVIIEEAIQLLLGHSLGSFKFDEKNKLFSIINLCKGEKLLDTDEIDKIHEVRKIANSNGHEFGYDEEVPHDKVHFVVMQTLDLLNVIEKKIGLV